MKLAIVSDIHGNLEAFTAVLRDIESQNVDKIHFLGDVVGYGCNPAACLELVHKLCDTRLMGNHEFAVLGRLSTDQYAPAAKESAAWTQAQLSDFELACLEELEISRTVDDLFFVHASAYEPEQWHYVLDEQEAQLAFDHLDQSICFFGHSHVPVVFSEKTDGPPRKRAGHSFQPNEEDRYLINVGSVGQPRDKDPRACYVTYDTYQRDLEYHRVEYDIAKTQQKMASANLPQVLIDRLTIGR